MCGRFFVSESELDDFAAIVHRVEKDLYPARPNGDGTFDILPGDRVPVIAAIENVSFQQAIHQDETLASQVLKGPLWTLPVQYLMPFWGFPSSYNKGKIINARAETVAGKPMFWSAFATRRCLVSAKGYYEWSTEGVLATKPLLTTPAVLATEPLLTTPEVLATEPLLITPAVLATEPLLTTPEAFIQNEQMTFFGFDALPKKNKNGKQKKWKYRFTRKDNQSLWFGGLYQNFINENGATYAALVLMTVAANDDVLPIHDRMPLMIEEENHAAWLFSQKTDAIFDLLIPLRSGILQRQNAVND